MNGLLHTIASLKFLVDGLHRRRNFDEHWYTIQTAHNFVFYLDGVPEVSKNSFPPFAYPYFAVYLALIRSTQPTTSPSFGPNLPQTMMHIGPKGISRYALVQSANGTYQQSQPWNLPVWPAPVRLWQAFGKMRERRRLLTKRQWNSFPGLPKAGWHNSGYIHWDRFRWSGAWFACMHYPSF